jgi:hypothetical protein
MSLERVRVTTLRNYFAPGHTIGSAIRPAALKCVGTRSAAPLNLNVKWCRFEGVFLESVLLEGPIDATFEFNRFAVPALDDRPEKGKIVNAVSVHIPISGETHVTLESNTFSRFTHVLRIDKLPPADSGSRFVLRNNLAIGDARDAWVWVNSQPAADVAKPFFVGSGGNVCRPRTMAKAKSISNGVVPRKFIQFGSLNIDPASNGFLRYQKTGDGAQLLTAGAGGGPVGVPPVE